MIRSTRSDKKSGTKKRAEVILLRILAIAFWIIVWEALALKIDSQLILASPVQVIKRLWELVWTPEVWQVVLFSLTRISLGFLSALVLGGVLALLSSRLKAVKLVLAPITSCIKSTPVASFVILAIIWFGSKNLSVFISFLMVFPVIYLNLLKGLESVDKELSEMSRVFSIGRLRRFLYITMPQLMPFVLSACSVALGLCWKSGVAAEVIGISTGSIGERLYRAKLYFETGDLLAWTVIIILVSTAIEKLVITLLGVLSELPAKKYSQKSVLGGLSTDKKEPSGNPSGSPCGIKIDSLEKSYDGVKVLDGLSETVSPGEHIAIMGHSGAGKTTLIRILLGLERKDSGTAEVQPRSRPSAVFQEDRLVLGLSAVGNAAVAGCPPDRTAELLLSLGLSEGMLLRPTRELSGGERRRVSLARALMKDSGLVVMDEPFKGIDDATLTQLVLPRVRELTAGRTLVLVTHSREEALALCDRIITL